MYAIDIAKFAVCLTLGVALINSLGVFPVEFIPTDESLYSPFNPTVANGMQLPEDPTVMDYFQLTASFIWQSMFWIINIVLIPLKIIPWALTSFGIPPIIATIINAAVFFAIIMGIIQWKRGASTEGYE